MDIGRFFSHCGEDEKVGIAHGILSEALLFFWLGAAAGLPVQEGSEVFRALDGVVRETCHCKC